MNKNPAEYGEVVVETNIQASPHEVWQALTENIGHWWPADFYAGGEDGKRSFSIEAKPGGLMKETWSNGGGVLWGTVICANPGVQLQVLGALFPNWGGPSQWFGSWDLSASGTGTKLRFSESTVGRIADAGLGEKQEGWEFLGNALKEYAENQ
jgi:uncharacterized protein YndB with AHSA1/START domain